MNSWENINGSTGDSLLEATMEFWNNNPCDGHENIRERMTFRYKKEPWLPHLLDTIASRHSRIIEVGCGQGTDALYCCARLRPDASYTAVDYSDDSIAMAEKSVNEYADRLSIRPMFTRGNAEALDLPDSEFDCAISLGVIHHTPDIAKAISEIHRVLKIGGCAYISIYRRFSPKLISANAIRFISRSIDMIARRKNVLYERSARMGTNHFLGTMLHECLGVPILNSYTKHQVRKLFSEFEIESIMPIGMGLPHIGINKWIDRGSNPFGAQWLIIARKSGGSLPH